MESDELKKLKLEHQKTIKMFLDRDIKLRETSDQILEEQAENQKSIKMLVQRDIQLREINERLEAMDREKSQFISVAAHQLRTPLTAIKWIAQILQKNVKKDPATPNKDHILKLNQIVQKMVQLIGDILNVARIEEGRFGLDYKESSMVELIDDILKTAEVTIHSKKITLITKIDKTIPLFKFDKDKMRLAIMNIIDNAIKYTPNKGKVTINTTHDSSYINISVQDSGIGIAKEDYEQLFNKFYRGNNALKQDTEGTGLGLFIANNIVKAHKGSITFNSSIKKGTTFTINIPLNK